MEELILQADCLVKNFGSFRVLDGISFGVPKGKIIGLLGPNGAGKTTTINILLGITLQDGGVVKYFGRDFAKHRELCLQKINFASSFNTLQGKISVAENLLVFARLYRIQRPEKKIRELTRYFEIEDLLSHRFWDLSSGQKTRVNLVKSLINDPELILMDEPTASLDPDIADKTLSLIEQLRKERGLSILYTSHNMDEVTRICDEVIFLDAGRIVAHDTPLGLTKQVRVVQLQLAFDGSKAAVERYLLSENQKFSFLHDYLVLIDTEEKLMPKIISQISEQGIEVTDIDIKKPTLEDIFLQIARGNYVG
ncbi:MAG: ABC transporter ATP-binding protein [Parcubacteria group bacterium]|nr:ABC transporter ATP-binding protein [Parcubacteria group bacterium]